MRVPPRPPPPPPATTPPTKYQFIRDGKPVVGHGAIDGRLTGNTGYEVSLFRRHLVLMVEYWTCAPRNGWQVPCHTRAWRRAKPDDLIRIEKGEVVPNEPPLDLPPRPKPGPPPP